MEESEQQPIQEKHNRFRKFLPIATILFISFVFFSGIIIGQKTTPTLLPTITPTPTDLPLPTPTTKKKIYYTPTDLQMLLLMLPGVNSQIVNDFSPLQCIYSESERIGQDSLTTDQLQSGIQDTTLSEAIKEIKNKQYEYTVVMMDEDKNGKQFEKSRKKILVHTTINFLSSCKDDEKYYFLYNANVDNTEITKQLSIINQVYAGGPGYYPLPYLAIIQPNEKINYIPLTDSLIYNQISTEQLQKNGYTDTRIKEYLHPFKIIGKTHNSILFLTRTACYECRDNPNETGLFKLNTDPISAKELGFCKENQQSYPVISHTCYDGLNSYTFKYKY